jgi:hypothetical protein
MCVALYPGVSFGSSLLATRRCWWRSTTSSYSSGFRMRRAVLPWLACCWGNGTWIVLPLQLPHLRQGADVLYYSFSSRFGMG